MLAYILYENLSSEKLVRDVNKLLDNFRKNNPDTTPILCITIRTISQDNNSLIPKLEFSQNVPPNVSNSPDDSSQVNNE